MTSRERLLNLLNGKRIDSVPVSPRVHINIIYEFFKTRDVDIVAGAIDVYRHYGMDIINWNCTPCTLEKQRFEFTDFTIEGPNWRPQTKIEKNDNTATIITTVQTPKGSLKRVISKTTIGPWEDEIAITEQPIKTEEDFELFVKYQPPVPRIDTSEIARDIKLIGDDGVSGPSISGPFNFLVYSYRSLEKVMIDITMNLAFYHRMMEYFLCRLLKYYEQYLDQKPALIDIGANIANGRMVSADFLVEHILPYENRLADFVQERSVAALYHQCGHAANHLSIFDQLHHKIWGYVAPPPHGDCVLEEVIKKVPKDMILWGYVDQIDFLRKAAPKEIEEHVYRIMEIIKPRGNYILGTTDYLETNTPPENLRAFVNAGRKYGKY